MITGSIQQQFLKIFSIKLLSCKLGNKPLPPRKGGDKRGKDDNEDSSASNNFFTLPKSYNKHHVIYKSCIGSNSRNFLYVCGAMVH